MAITYGFCLDADSTLYNSQQFSGTFQKAFGDGVCLWGSEFVASIEGFNLTLGSGFALAAGRWVKNTEPIAITVPSSSNYEDRTDLVCIQVDNSSREAKLTLVSDVDLNNLPKEPYTVPLYSVFVKRGSSNLLLGDLTDLRSKIPPLSSITADALRAYDFVTGGIDREVARILGLGQLVIDKAEKAIVDIDLIIQAKGAFPAIGELTTSKLHPKPISQWLLCDGGNVPFEYSQLIALIGDTLPNILPEDPRFPTYIYGGEPII